MSMHSKAKVNASIMILQSYLLMFGPHFCFLNGTVGGHYLVNILEDCTFTAVFQFYLSHRTYQQVTVPPKLC